MSKLQALPGQEVLPIEPVQPHLLERLDAVRYVNAHEGMLFLEDLPEERFDPERPMSYVEFMGAIGLALAEEPPKSSTWDDALDVHGEDFEKASIKNLTKGLYFSPSTSRQRSEVVTIGKRQPTIHLPGLRHKDEGVAVAGNEFTTIARSASDFVKHIHAKTIEANEKRPPSKKLDAETLANAAGRATVHGLRSKKEALLALDVELKIERIALRAVNELAAGREVSENLSLSEMDWYRRVSALAIHNTVKVASHQLGYGTTVRSGINRALVSTFYRSEAETRAAALQNYTRWAGYYIDAKRGKINQSLQLCGEEFGKYRHFLKTKEPVS
ncbi:MAG TPA: hypothetical protein VHC21_01180 [Candidatus Saccharimonadales bacterium]|nr:hypothetical protein [Candidatus Saccharimonadales bacterium]